MNYKRRYLAVFGEIGASKPLRQTLKRFRGRSGGFSRPAVLAAILVLALTGTAFDFIRIHYLAPGQDEISEHVPEAEL